MGRKAHEAVWRDELNQDREGGRQGEGEEEKKKGERKKREREYFLNYLSEDSRNGRQRNCNSELQAE